MEKIARIVPFVVDDYDEEDYAFYLKVSEKEARLLDILEKKEYIRYEFISIMNID